VSVNGPARPDSGGSALLRRLPMLREFLHQEAVASVLLLAATLIALAWANSPASESYFAFWHHELSLGFGSLTVTEDLQHWVNDGLMAIFFFVVGLEIKRELVTGELREPKAAILPVLAALGGVALPALIFVAIVGGGPAGQGWGVPMATDIAFAVGVLALFGARAGAGAKLFLLSVAIVDDLIAITVIALVYSGPISLGWLAFAGAGLAVVVLMRRFATSPWAYVLPALLIWFAILESGVHATIAGVLLGLLTPASPVRGRPVLEQLEHLLHPVSAIVIIPIFAMANAGVDLRGGVLGVALHAPLTWAVAIGLLVGKTIGIAGVTLAARRAGIGTLPTGMPLAQVWPVAALGGIGFTVALFIADLAFEDPNLIIQAKVGIFAGSIAAAVLGCGLLLLTSRSSAAVPSAQDGSV
jgi:Na+:H+ antiporter, NhaA family